jgi:hypothetical protein
VAITYRVKDENGAEAVIRYKPEGRATIGFQEIAFVPDAVTRPTACAILLPTRCADQARPWPSQEKEADVINRGGVR